MITVAKLISAISISQKRRKHFLFFPNTKTTRCILKILRNNGFIHSFRYCIFHKKTFVEILLKNVEKITKLQNAYTLVSSPSRIKYFSGLDVRKFTIAQAQIGILIVRLL